jgi:hypothetical protein
VPVRDADSVADGRLPHDLARVHGKEHVRVGVGEGLRAFRPALGQTDDDGDGGAGGDQRTCADERTPLPRCLGPPGQVERRVLT